jgi:NAD(P)-dependent dehydrogenase (short-subunit alcohol dehydrogenase family)
MINKQFTNKTIIITGAATGIGATTAQLFSEQGAKVFALDIHPLTYTAENVEYIQCDVANFEQVKDHIEDIVDSIDKLDFLFSNAGIHGIATLEDTSLEQIDNFININIKGVLNTLKCVLPVMREQRHGSVVLMGSDQCFIGKPASALYGLTKGAIGQLTKSLAIDYAAYNVRVNCVCPGTVDTPIARRAVKFLSEQNAASEADIMAMFEDCQPVKRLATTMEIAKTVAFMCSEGIDYMTGSLIPIDGGITAQ